MHTVRYKISIKKLKLLTSTFIIALSSCASAVPSSPSAECTTGISNLLKLVTSKEFFDDSSENLIKKSASFLQIAKNETEAPSNYSTRATKISLKKESWLDKGDISYVSDNGSPAKFSRADFVINLTCSPKHKDFLTLATKNIKGKFVEAQVPELDKLISREWTMPDPEDGLERHIEVSEATDSLTIKVERTVSPAEAEGEP